MRQDKNLTTGAVSLFVFLAVLLTKPIWTGLLEGNSGLGLSLAVFLVFLFIGVPIGFVLAAGAVLYLFVSGTVAVTAVSLTMQNSLMNFVLLAIPFFVMAGYIMTEGGLSERLIHFVVSLVGRVRGGLFHVIIVVTYIVSGLSGSKVADVTAVGTTMNETLRREGYDMGETAAVLASAAIMGETVPPLHQHDCFGFDFHAVDRNPFCCRIASGRGDGDCTDDPDRDTCTHVGNACQFAGSA